MLYITTSRNPDKRMIELGRLLGSVIPYSVFRRRGVKPFERVVRDARRRGMDRILFITKENNRLLFRIIRIPPAEPRLSSLISVHDVYSYGAPRSDEQGKPDIDVIGGWDDIGLYYVDRVDPDDVGEWIRIRSEMRARARIERATRAPDLHTDKYGFGCGGTDNIVFFRCDNEASTLFGYEDSVFKMFEDADIEIRLRKSDDIQVLGIKAYGHSIRISMKPYQQMWGKW